MKNIAFWDVAPCALVRADVSEEHIASIIMDMTPSPTWLRGLYIIHNPCSENIKTISDAMNYIPLSSLAI
jgi:hypothetical protein